MTGAGTDFLSRLAANAVGAAPLVAPRLRSRFEPDADASAGQGMEWEEPGAGTETVAPAWSAASLRRTLAGPPAGAPLLPEPAAAETVADAPPAPRGRRKPAPAPRAAPARADDASLVPPKRAEPPVAPGPERGEIQPAKAPPRPDPTPLAADEGPTGPPAPPILRHAALPLAPPAPREAEPPPPPIRETVRLAAAEPAPTQGTALAVPDPAASAPQPLLAFAAPRALREALPPAPRRLERLPDAPAPATIVNITIGRVEVRGAEAAAPAVRARKEAPRPAPQSLADYLARRSAEA